MEIVTYVPKAIEENPYRKDIAELIEARNAAAENGDDPLNTGTYYTWLVSEAGKQRNKLGKAANLAGYTARNRHEESIDNEDGTKSVKILFTLSPKHKDRRNAEREHAKKENGEGDTNTDAVVEPTDNPDAPSNADAVDAEAETVEEIPSNEGEETAAETVESTPIVRNRRKR